MKKEHLKKIFTGFVLFSLALFWFQNIYNFTSATAEEYGCDSSDAFGVIRIRGEFGYINDPENGVISTDEIIDKLHYLSAQNNIQAIILDIESSGGLAVAGESIADTLRWDIQKQTFAVIQENGLSAAYLAATGADSIYVSELSNVGSIGITASFFNNSKKLMAEGVEFESLASVPFKDMYTLDKEITPEERREIMEDILNSHKILVSLIAENRKGFIEEETVAELADGSSYLGQEAIDLGLADNIGTVSDAIRRFEENEKVAGGVCTL